VLVQCLIMMGLATQARDLAPKIAEPGVSLELLRQWNEMTAWVRVPTPAEINKQMALILGPWSGIAQSQLTKHTFDPIIFSFMFGAETLAYMLFGMAALKSGYLTGKWTDAEYRRAAIRGYGISLPSYLVLIWLIFRNDFSVPALIACSMAATVIIRPFMIPAVAALVILFTRKGGWLTQRIAAAGRAAFTNYLGTSILMTGMFYGWGLGLWGEFSRAELWLVVIAMWVVMLAWSKPWLERFEYGPLEWLWRSLSRGSLQPMRKERPQPLAA
jgi:uncharacterized protein